MVMSLGGLPARAGAGLVARPGWARSLAEEG